MIESLKEAMVSSVKSYNEFNSSDDWRRADREVKKIAEYVEQLSTSREGLAFLFTLLTHSDDMIRSMIASLLLDNGFTSEKCMEVLQEVAERTDLIGLGASQALKRVKLRETNGAPSVETPSPQPSIRVKPHVDTNLHNLKPF